MTKYLLAAAAMMTGLTAVACGGNACDDAADRIKAKVETCGGTFPDTTSTDSGDSAECTDAAAKSADDAATAFEALDCDTVKAAYPAK